MSGQRVGYARVSTLDQKTDRQLDGVEVDRVFADHVCPDLLCPAHRTESGS